MRCMSRKCRLKDADGLELLMKRSFRTEDEVNVFSDIGAKFVKKCDGHPLSICEGALYLSYSDLPPTTQTVFPLVCLVASEFRYSPRCHVLVDC
jgi:hypothetical protein